LKPEERVAAEKLIAKVAELQETHPKRLVGALDPENKGDQAWAAKVVRTVGLAELEDFALYVEEHATSNALGKPAGLGLISEWAADFHRGAGERERQRQAAIEQQKKRQAFAAAAAERQRQEDALIEKAEAAWERLSIGEQIERLRKAEQELRADPHWQTVYRLNDKERRHQMELQAKGQLRVENEKREANEGGAR